jgi:hypothetical protein
MSDGRSESRFEVKLAPDRRRLILVLWLTEGTNFWVHDNGTYSYVPTEMEIDTLRMTYEAIDSYNKEQIFKKNIRPSS